MRVCVLLSLFSVASCLLHGRQELCMEGSPCYADVPCQAQPVQSPPHDSFVDVFIDTTGKTGRSVYCYDTSDGPSRRDDPSEPPFQEEKRTWWLKVAGNDRKLRVDTCATGATDMIAHIYVMGAFKSGASGEDLCEPSQLVCVGRSEYRPNIPLGCSYLQPGDTASALLDFCAMSGMNYYVGISASDVFGSIATIRISDEGQCGVYDPSQSASCSTSQALTLSSDGSYTRFEGDTSQLGTPFDWSPFSNGCAIGVVQTWWYSVLGDDKAISVDTCESWFDTFISVYSMSISSVEPCSSSLADCIASNDDSEACDVVGNAKGSSVSVCGQAGHQLYFAVSSNTGQSGKFAANFRLGDTCVTSACTFAHAVPLNTSTAVDTLAEAALVNFPMSCPAFRPFGRSFQNPYWNLFAISTGGVTARLVSIRLCKFPLNGAFPVLLSLFQADDCNDAEDYHCTAMSASSNCLLDPPQMGMHSDAAEISFCAQPGRDYYVRVEGEFPEFDGALPFRGQGTLDVVELGPCHLAEESCDAASSLVWKTDGLVHPAVYSYSFANPGEGQVCQHCGQVFRSYPIYAWLELEGSGHHIFLTTCDSTFDTAISVYEVACPDENDLCVASSRQRDENILNPFFGPCLAPGVRAELTFCSAPGIKYYVAVHSLNQLPGGADHQISLRAFQSLDECAFSSYFPSPFVTQVSNTSISIAWSPPSLDSMVEVYHVEWMYGTVNGSDSIGLNTTFILNGLDSGLEVFFTVCAVSDIASSCGTAVGNTQPSLGSCSLLPLHETVRSARPSVMGDLSSFLHGFLFRANKLMLSEVETVIISGVSRSQDLDTSTSLLFYEESAQYPGKLELFASFPIDTSTLPEFSSGNWGVVSIDLANASLSLCPFRRYAVALSGSGIASHQQVDTDYHETCFGSLSHPFRLVNYNEGPSSLYLTDMSTVEGLPIIDLFFGVTTPNSMIEDPREAPIVTKKNVRVHSATIFWAAVCGATSYVVRYKEDGMVDWHQSEENDFSATLYGLTANTLYDLQVVAVGDTREEAATDTFTTRVDGVEVKNFRSSIPPSSDSLRNSFVFPSSTCLSPSSNSIFSTGAFYPEVNFGPLQSGGEDVVYFTAPGERHGFVLRQSEDGDLIWAKQLVCTGTLRIADCTVDSSDSLYVTGAFFGEVDFGGGLSLSNSKGLNKWDLFVAKFSSSGETVWVDHGVVVDSEVYSLVAEGTAIVWDPFTSSILVCGYFQGNQLASTSPPGYVWRGLTFASNPGIQLEGITQMNGIVVRFSSIGTIEWARTVFDSQFAQYLETAPEPTLSFFANDRQFCVDVETDSAGGVYVGGSYEYQVIMEIDSQAADPSLNPILATSLSRGFEDNYIAKLSAVDGLGVWIRSIGGSNRESLTSSLAYSPMVVGVCTMMSTASSQISFDPAGAGTINGATAGDMVPLLFCYTSIGLPLLGGTIPMTTFGTGVTSQIHSLTSIAGTTTLLMSGVYANGVIGTDSIGLAFTDPIISNSLHHPVGFVTALDLVLFQASWIVCVGNGVYGDLGRIITKPLSSSPDRFWLLTSSNAAVQLDSFTTSPGPDRDEATYGLLTAVFRTETPGIFVNASSDTQVLGDSSNTIVFPPLPALTYPSNADQFWLIQPVHPALVIEVKVTLFLLADGDYLSFYSGSTADPSSLLGTFDGKFSRNTFRQQVAYQQGPGTECEREDCVQLLVRSSGPQLLVYFHSDSVDTLNGFRLQYSSSTEVSHCVQDTTELLIAQADEISQLVDGGYRPDARCSWRVSPASNTQFIVVRPTFFDLGKGDLVVLRDGDSETSPVIVEWRKSENGHGSIPGPVQTTSNALFVEFLSDSHGQGRGFVISYEAVKEKVFCDGLTTLRDQRGSFQSQPSTILDHADSSTCVWSFEGTDISDQDHIVILFDAVNTADQLSVSFTDYQGASQTISDPITAAMGGHYISYAQHATVEFVAEPPLSQGRVAGQYCIGATSDVCTMPDVVSSENDVFETNYCGGYYGPNADCRSRFVATSTRATSMLVISGIQMGNTESLFGDFLEVSNVLLDGSLELLNTITCDGTANCANLVAHSTHDQGFDVRFVSDHELLGKFTLTWCSRALVSTGNPQEDRTVELEQLCGVNGTGSTQLTDVYGTFSNEFCGGTYGPNAECRWILGSEPAADDPVIVVIREGRFPKGKSSIPGDFLLVREAATGLRFVYSGQGTYEPLPGSTNLFSRKTSDEVPDPIVITAQGVAEVSFYSDGEDFGSSFIATYCVLPSGVCTATSDGGKVLIESQGAIATPGCDGFYASNIDCSWVIAPPIDSTTDALVIYFEMLELHPDQDVISANPDTVATDTISLFNGALTDLNNCTDCDARLVCSFTGYGSSRANGAPCQDQRYNFLPGNLPNKAAFVSSGPVTVLFQSNDRGSARGIALDFCVEASPIASCGGPQLLTSLSGAIHDRKCGSGFLPPKDCYWTIQRPVEKKFIILIVEELDILFDNGQAAGTGFNTQTPYVYLEVFDGDDRLQSTFTESGLVFNDAVEALEPGSALFGTQENVTVHFYVVDGYPSRPGFKLNYVIEDDDGQCKDGPTTVSDHGATIRSHKYGASYRRGTCRWLVSFPPLKREVAANDQVVVLRVTALDLRAGVDYVVLYDGPDETSSVLAFLTGSLSDLENNIIFSSGGPIFVVFSSVSDSRAGVFEAEVFSNAQLIQQGCPLLCAGHGTCDADGCTCITTPDPFFGDGCSIPPPPRVLSAILTSSLNTILVRFNRPTDRAGMFRSALGEQYDNCERVLSNSDTARMGDGVRCVWASDEVLEVRLGELATILPGETLTVLAANVREPNPSDQAPFGVDEELVLQLDAFLDPVPVPVAPAIFATDLTVDASASFLDGSRPMVFQWSIARSSDANGTISLPVSPALSSLVTSTVTSKLFIPEVLLPSNSYFLVSVIATNFLGITSAPVTTTSYRADSTPSLAIRSGRFQEVYVFQDTLIPAQLVIPSLLETIVGVCPDVIYIWSIVSGSSSFPLDATSATNTLLIPAFTLVANGNYTLSLTVIISPSADQPIVLTDSTTLRTVQLDLEAFIVGGDRDFPVDSALQLDVELRTDTSLVNHASLSFFWSCSSLLTGGACISSQSFSPVLFPTPSPSITIPANELSPGRYVFEMMASSNDPSILPGTATVTITLLPSNSIRLSLLTSNVHAKVNPREVVALDGVIEGPVVDPVFSWSVVSGDLDLSNPERIRSEDIESSRLILAPYALVGGSETVIALRVRDGARVGHAQISLYANTPPFSGSIVAVPSTGEFDRTIFELQVATSMDETTDMPLQYFFRYRPLDCSALARDEVSGSCPEIPIGGIQSLPSVRAVFPPGIHEVIGYVVDRFSAASFSVVTVTVEGSCDFEGSETIVRKLTAIANHLRCIGDLQLLSQYSNALIQYMDCIDFSQANVTAASGARALFRTTAARMSDHLAFVSQHLPPISHSIDVSAKSGLLQSAAQQNRQIDISDARQLVSIVGSAAGRSLQAGFIDETTPKACISALSNVVDVPQSSSLDGLAIQQAAETTYLGTAFSLPCESTASQVTSRRISTSSRPLRGKQLHDLELTTTSGGKVQFPGALYVPTFNDDCVVTGLVEYTIPIVKEDINEQIVSPVSISLFKLTNNAVQKLPATADLPSQPIRIEMNSLELPPDENQIQCVSYDEITLEWTSAGCELLEVQDGKTVVCGCTHLTHFGALFDGGGGGGGGGGSIDLSQALSNFAGSVLGNIASDANLDQIPESAINEQGQLIASQFTGDASDLEDLLESDAAFLQYVAEIEQQSSSVNVFRDNLAIYIAGYSLSLAVIVGMILFLLAAIYVKPLNDFITGRGSRAKAQQKRRRVRALAMNQESQLGSSSSSDSVRGPSTSSLIA